MKFETVSMETPAVRATSAIVGRLRCNNLAPIEAFQTLATEPRNLNEIIFQRTRVNHMNRKMDPMETANIEPIFPILKDFQYKPKASMLLLGYAAGAGQELPARLRPKVPVDIKLEMCVGNL